MSASAVVLVAPKETSWHVDVRCCRCRDDHREEHADGAPWLARFTTAAGGYWQLAVVEHVRREWRGLLVPIETDHGLAYPEPPTVLLDRDTPAVREVRRLAASRAAKEVGPWDKDALRTFRLFLKALRNLMNEQAPRVALRPIFGSAQIQNRLPPNVDLSCPLCETSRPLRAQALEEALSRRRCEPLYV